MSIKLIEYLKQLLKIHFLAVYSNVNVLSPLRTFPLSELSESNTATFLPAFLAQDLAKVVVLSAENRESPLE